MGVETGFAQIVAEELDVAPQRVQFVMGDTSTTTDQGGVGGSTSIALGAKPLRNVAATARYLLLQLAAQRLGAQLDQLQVRDGIVSVQGDASKSVSYGDLAGADGSERCAQSFWQRIRPQRRRNWKTQGSRKLYCGRKTASARGHRSENSRTVAIRHRCARPGHAARARDSSGACWREARERGRRVRRKQSTAT